MYNFLMDNFNKRRLNTQILTKTQLALQAIKRYDMEQQRGKVNYSNPHNSNRLLNDLEYDYSKLTSHKLLKLDHNYKISLFPYSEEFYNLEMKNYIFPMRVVVKNVKNQCTIFIGYDQPYPGIEHQNKMAVFEKDTHSDKNYDSKTIVNRDLIIILKNKGNKQISNVYFTIVAGKSFFMCDFKVEFLGFVRDERVHSEVKLSSNSHKIEPRRYTENASQLLSKRTKTNPSERESSYNKEFVRSKITLDKLDRPVKVQEFSLLSQLELVKHHSKSNVSMEQTGKKFHTKKIFYPTQTIRNTITKDFKKDHKRDPSELDMKLEEVKRNKEMMEEFKVKDKELRETASKCKRMIESYKKTFNEETVRRRKLNKDMVLILYCSKFIHHTYAITENRVGKQANKIKVSYLVNKFAKRLRQRYDETCKIEPFRFKRIIIEDISGISFFSKLINKPNATRAEKILKQTFDYLHPMLLVKHSISVANSYRNSVKTIQRMWKTKYHGRLYCLLYFIDNHVQRMLKEFPHFGIFQGSFYQSKSNRMICLEYIKDESEKYRFIYEAYRRKLQQIQEIVRMNQTTLASKSKNKTLLEVPRKPTKPMHRFFRNSDILKSMVRTWFEIQYKKYIKKSQKQLKY